VIPTLPAAIDTPALVVDLEIVEANIERMQRELASRGVALRPHTKTHKIVRLARMQLDAGAAGITVGTLGEAEVMVSGGIRDVFVAYPVIAIGPKAGRLRDLHDRAELIVGVDSAEGARALSAAVAGASGQLRVAVEIDSGQARTGVAPADAPDIARVARDAGLEVAGVFTHGGHAYAAPERVASAAADEVASLAEAAAALRAAGFETPMVSAGSTPTALLSATGAVTEHRPGTYVFGDRQQVALGAIRPQAVALHVAATVVSAHEGRFVIDAGAKTLTKDIAPYLPGYGAIPAWPNAMIERLSDYHGVVTLPHGEPGPQVGDVIAVVPNHVCPVVNEFDTLLIVREGRPVDRWPVDARGRNG
jgi:D-serine deaminase-like pyridoxal phosphate-dependent protein